MKNTEKQTAIQKLAERLHDPLQFRIFVTGVILAVGYVGVYMPLDSRIAETTQRLTKSTRSSPACPKTRIPTNGSNM